jgi:hypothetical protein
MGFLICFLHVGTPKVHPHLYQHAAAKAKANENGLHLSFWLRVGAPKPSFPNAPGSAGAGSGSIRLPGLPNHAQQTLGASIRGTGGTCGTLMWRFQVASSFLKLLEGW